MSKRKPNLQGITPVGTFDWARLNADTIKIDNYGKSRFQIELELEGKEATDFIKSIDTFYRENISHGRNATNKPYTIHDYKQSANFKFWTGTTYKDGTPKSIMVVDRDGDELADTITIGNGSTGRVMFSMEVYDFDGKSGVTLYLEGVQVKKLVKYTNKKLAFDAI